MADVGLWKAGWLKGDFYSAWDFGASLGAILAVGCLFLLAKRFIVARRCAPDGEPGKANRMLALAFQGQGQLDLAFEKFRLCPMDQGLMENLYHLALAFEGKGQFAQAEAVFRHMADHDLDFRDLPQRLARARMLSEGASPAAAPGQPARTLLGGYRLEKTLGKGAMGIVYRGWDPKADRPVAIKTLALSQAFDEDALAEVKERFFREVETAGRLQHPHIVAMYGAGEDQDLAYIAMEWVAGGDLVPFTKPDRLLPLPRVLALVARVAEALDYAHRHQVVHRDIKPANILYEPETGQVKVTDFGIARLTDSSKTRTGMVLGTPSYMSPEQLAGRKVDGRSDLFSLGVTLYQLCAGQLPFVGQSMAQLMARIVNEPPAELASLNPALPPQLVEIIARALRKDPAQRYQRGADLAADLQACLAALGPASASPAFAQGEEQP